MRRPNPLSGPYLERAAHLRKDEAYIAQALSEPSTVLVPVWRSRSLVRRGEPGLTAAYVEASHGIRASLAATDLVMLGQFEGRVYFAAEIIGEEPPQIVPDARFEDLRMAAAQLPAQEAGVLAYARAMVYWRQRHRYCGLCGSPTVSTSAGHVMKCSNPACATDHFPRIDPAIIVLVSDGERALLGRQAAWPAGRYSTIAGFVEPGESLEDAVAREVLEETGVTVVEAEYHSSQPWPFPASLMIGYVARAAAGAVPKADDELEDVRWFSREDIAAGLAGLPPSQSVSFRLIEDWYDAGAAIPLRQTPGLKTWLPERR